MRKNRGTFKYPLEGDNPILHLLDDSFVKAMTVRMNKRKGQIQEELAEQVLRAFLREDLHATPDEQIILRDVITFKCFSPPDTKRRRIDLYLPTQRIAVEVKSYRVGRNRMIRGQIAKDRWLVENGEVEDVMWLLMEGATRPTLRALDKAGLYYLNVAASREEITNWK